MRVSTRRMRMALRVFEEYLDREAMRPVLKGLRRTGRMLGAVRDLDVFQEKTQHYLDGLPAERAGDLDGLLAACRAERERSASTSSTYLDGDRYRRFVERFRELLDGPLDDARRRRRPATRGRSASRRSCPACSTTTWAWCGPSRAARRPRDAAAAVPRAAQGLQGPALHARVLRGRARPRRPAAHQEGEGPAGPPRRPAGRRRHLRHPARLPHLGHVAPRRPRRCRGPSRSSSRRARRGTWPRARRRWSGWCSPSPRCGPRWPAADFSRELATVIADI